MHAMVAMRLVVKPHITCVYTKLRKQGPGLERLPYTDMYAKVSEASPFLFFEYLLVRMRKDEGRLYIGTGALKL